jgi:hypothetical protein
MKQMSSVFNKIYIMNDGVPTADVPLEAFSTSFTCMGLEMCEIGHCFDCTGYTAMNEMEMWSRMAR